MLLLLAALALGAASERGVWLPYPAGTEARVGQGPFSTGSHQGCYAWDFELPEGTPIVAPVRGRVLQVVDDRTVEGTQRFHDSNRVMLDVGGGRCLTLVHHRPGTARVRPGDRVEAGQPLAEVGKSGTIVPHIHLDLRGPTWERSWPVAFRMADGDRELRAGDRALSATQPSAQPTTAFAESTLSGDAFAAAGIRLSSGGPAFLWKEGARLSLRGRVTRPASEVRFALWKDAEPSELLVSAPVVKGRFQLDLALPPGLTGPRWYRLEIPGDPGTATVPVGILPAGHDL
ncbi:MAG: M23 family metallopeptidase [Candidatus Eremiobacterota bacterium]